MSTWTDLRAYGGRLRSAVEQLLGAGPSHRRRLSAIDTRIVVTGVRGKSTTVRWLHDIFHERGYDTYAKVTGTEPLSIYNGEEHEIPRPEQVRLYENESELRKFDPDDVAIFENQGIREYTTRLINESFVKPDVVFLTNVREDHLGTLGNDRFSIARSLARAVPEGTHVVNGEQDPQIQEFLESQLHRRDATVTHVELPAEARLAPGIESVYGLDDVLATLDEPPLSAAKRDSLLAQLDPAWRQLDAGRIHNAADANDVQSTELIRRSLPDSDRIEPVVFLRWDRRGRTASFLRYLERLADAGVIEQAHALGTDRELFERRASFPVVTHDTETTTPERVLDATLGTGRPVFLMGNTVDEFMEAIQETIEDRALEPAQVSLLETRHWQQVPRVRPPSLETTPPHRLPE